MHRLHLINNQFEPAQTSQAAAPAAPATKKDSLTVLDNRTGKNLIQKLIQ